MCSNSPVRRSSAGRQRGLSIIELMVSIVVSLLVGLAATGSAMMFTATQRQGVGTGGVAVNTGTVLSAIKDDVAVAGLGFFGDSNFLCNTLNLSVGAAVAFDGTAFSPLRVTRTAASDTIDVVFATRVESGANVRLAAVSNGSAAALSSFLPVEVNQAVLLAPGTPSNLSPCLVRTVTATAGPTSDTPQQLTFGNAGQHNAAAFTTNPGFDDQGRVTLLGALRWNRYRVDNGNLIMERPLEGTSAIIARNVISFRMQYGTAAAAGVTSLENWEDPVDAFSVINSVNLPRIRAVRIGMIVRSPQVEKASATTGQCSATDAKPALFGLAAENLANTDWNCFRYRTTTVVVPIRNVVMGLR